MTYPTREHEDLLRRALRAAGDSVEPAGDGLERIRARLTAPRPTVAAWMMCGAEPAALRVRPFLSWLHLRIGQAFSRIGPAFGRIGPAFARLGPAFARLGQALAWLRTGGGIIKTGPRWLRPAAAMAAFAVIIGSGAFAISALQHTITQRGVNTGLGQRESKTGGQTSGGGVNGTGQELVPPNQSWLPLHTGSTPAPIPPSPSATASPTPSCTATVAPSQSPVPNVTTTPPAPSVTPTPTPTPTDTNPSPSISPSPGASPAPSTLAEAAVMTGSPAPVTGGTVTGTASPPPPTSTVPC